MDGFMHGMMGEKLGAIGTQLEPSTASLPKWKQDFISKPSASMRKGIAWKFDAPYEDTDTLVLTTTSSNFVDIRFPKDAKSSQDVIGHPSFWAFSGKAETTFYDATANHFAAEMPYTAHCKFIHDIDSRGPGISDEGDMFILANGDSLEMGIMPNPATGQPELYKEYWVSAGAIGRSGAADDSRTCVVAHVVDSDSVRGIVIRLGSRIQGIVSKKGADGSDIIEVERQMRKTKAHGKPSSESNAVLSDDVWERDIRSNGQFPCDWLRTPDRKMRDKIEFDGLVWQISEVHR